MEIQSSDGNNYCFSSISEPMTACLICLKRIAESTSEISFDEILSEMFEILSKYMEWSPPPAYKFNFKYDPFPFCKECIFGIINLCKLHEQMAEIRTQINQASVQIQGKIIQSQNGGSIIKEKECSGGLSQQDYLQRSDKMYTSREKCNYYRSLIHKRFTPSVKLSLDLLREAAPDCRRKTPCKGDSDNYSTPSKEDLQQPPCIERLFPDGVTTRTIKKEHEKVMLNNYLGLYRETSFTKSNEKSPGVLEYLVMDKLPSRSDNNLWICNICTFPFSKKSDFVHHMKICPGTKSSQLIPPGDIKGPLVAKVPIQPIRKDVKLKDPDFASMSSENRETLMNYLRVYQNQIFNNATSQEANNFTVMYDGKYHFGRLSDNSRWCCIFCDEKFANMSCLTIHLKTCPGCPPPNNTKQTFRYRRYIYDQLTNGKFHCRHCGMFSTKYGITVHVDKCHVESSTSSRTERARMPTKVIHKENKFRDCKEVCIIERPHCCDICGESFKERYEVLKHKASTHLRSSSKQNNILCKVCGKKFVNLGLLIAHKTMYASGTCCRLQNEFICKICKMNFVSKALLCKHQLSHKDSRPFCCEFCRKTFKSKYAMRMHRAWTHLRNSHKKFACEICGEKFDRLLLLTLHDKVHEEAVVDEKIS